MVDYSRQEDLDLEVPDAAVVIGAGGIGSWAALNMALVGTETVAAVDPDYVEESNLNRTPYTDLHLNMPKVEALTELIYERRNVEVYGFHEKVERLTDEHYGYIPENAAAIDCRDVADPLPERFRNHVGETVALGYDGFSTTIHIEPDHDSVFGEDDPRYRETPSFAVPPQVAASLATLHLCTSGNESMEDAAATFDVRNLLSGLFQE